MPRKFAAAVFSAGVVVLRKCVAPVLLAWALVPRNLLGRGLVCLGNVLRQCVRLALQMCVAVALVILARSVAVVLVTLVSCGDSCGKTDGVGIYSGPRIGASNGR